MFIDASNGRSASIFMAEGQPTSQQKSSKAKLMFSLP
jgi:hypothetical protein